jgi:putative hydrolase of the HAD superfamily
MDQRCSFCRVLTNQVEKIIFGTHFNICSDCIRTCLGVLDGETVTGWNITTSPQRCGNCARRPSEGYRHLVNRAVYSPRICERCIRIFTEILLRELPTLEDELQEIIHNVFVKPDTPLETDRSAEMLEKQMLDAMQNQQDNDPSEQDDTEQQVLKQMRDTMQTQTREKLDELTEQEQRIATDTTEIETQPTGRLASTLQKPLGLLFDLGDTLLTHLNFDPEAGIVATLNIAHNPSGYTAKDIHKHLEKINRDLIPRREEAQVEFHPHIVQRHVYEALHITFDRTPEEIERVFWRAAMSWKPEPGIEKVLETLHKKGIPMGIVSNAAFSGTTLWWEIEQQGLADYFRFLMSSADYWVRKPHPLLLETAAAKLRLKPADVWYVGNSPQYDIAAALNAGLGAIWYNRQNSPLDGPDPHVEIKSWSELLDLFEQY